jgi:hypothetical protein
MRIAITGHTKGIGLALKEYYEKDHIVIGFSRTNGYNITDYKRIVQESLDCDIFINNAYYENYQTLLLEKLYQHWKDTEKIIVNIGTVQTEYFKQDYDSPYFKNKLNLKTKFKELCLGRKICRLIMVYPGATNTSMIANADCKKMEPEKIAEIIDFAIKNLYVRELTAYIL